MNEEKDTFAYKQQTIRKLELLDLENEPDESISGLVSELFFKLELFVPFLLEGSLYYRGIVYEEKPQQFSQIIYPPKHLAKPGRANLEGQQIFYATDSKKAVFYELDVKVGQTMVLSEWVLVERLVLNHLGYNQSNLRKLGASDDQEFLNLRRHVSEDSFIIYEYLAKSFSQKIDKSNRYLYKLTTAIASFLLHEPMRGMAYPTVRYNANANNFAFHPFVIDSHLLDFQRAEFIEVIDIVDDKYIYKILDIATRKRSGNLIWENLGDKWTVTDETPELIFRKDNGEIRAISSYGDPVTPDEPEKT